MASSSSSITATVAHAVSFLTRPLTASYSPSTISKLRLILEANLTALYAPTWAIADPLRGSGRRCLTLSPDCLPPRAIYAACVATGVQWFDWMALLGGVELDFLVDPGCVSVRVGKKGFPTRTITIWADEVPSPAPLRSSYPEAAVRAPLGARTKTLAQQLLEHDDEDDLFSMIHEVRAPTWKADSFPMYARSTSPLSSISTDSTHSRCSSRSSNSSGSFSLSSASSASTSIDDKKLSRRERTRQARVFVDTTKTDVTPYDGGKTTVLTGGVMLGGGAKKTRPVSQMPVAASGWRAIRV